MKALALLWNLPLINCGTKGFICGLAYRDGISDKIHCAASPSKCTKTSPNVGTKRKPSGRARKRPAVRRERPLWIRCGMGVYL